MAKEKKEIEFEIMDVYEKNGTLRVWTRCKYGEDNLGLDVKQKYLNPVTGEPKFLNEVRDLLYRKYKLAKKKELKELYKFKGKKFNTKPVE